MHELVFETVHDDGDEISDLLIALGALSVSVEDARASSDEERPIFGEPGSTPFVQAWPHSKITALVDESTDAHALWKAFCQADPRFEDAVMELRWIADRDWVAETQRQFEPFQIGERLWVGPRWLAPPTLAPSAITMRIDPGMAFGTGSHATTQLCLEMLVSAMDRMQGASEDRQPCAIKVLDMGCGSGILAIAAAKLGAADVTAVDIDPVAVRTTQANTEENGVTLRVLDAEQTLASATTAAGATSDAAPVFDIVMANILAQPLKIMAPALTRNTRPGGALLLSGILARQSDDILNVYRPLARHLGEIRVLAERDGWVCIGTLGG